MDLLFKCKVEALSAHCIPLNKMIRILLEFKAVMVLPTITRNYGNYPYGNYVGNAPVGKVITLNT